MPKHFCHFGIPEHLFSSFLLFSQSSLLLFLHFFQTLLKFGFFHRFCFGNLNLLEQFLIVDKFTDNPCLKNSNQCCNEIVIAQSGRVAVEYEQEHDRHNVHHSLHSFHLVVLRLIAIVHNHIDNIGRSH